VAYCTKDDLLTGDIPLAGKYGDGTSFVNLTADEIDAEIGHIYVTPIDFDALEADASDAQVAAMRPSKLLLKKINRLLASGRIVLDMAAGGEDRQLHAYGTAMWQEAKELLEYICKGSITLQVPRVGDDSDETKHDNTKVSLVQDDGYSLVKNFYDRYSTPVWPYTILPPVIPGELPPARPYDTDNKVLTDGLG
jgi:hypothetical protein